MMELQPDPKERKRRMPPSILAMRDALASLGIPVDIRMLAALVGGGGCRV
jgi:hypothetical protein